MGQEKALIYKQWIITKRNKFGFICQLVTPIACLVIAGILKILTDDAWNHLKYVNHERKKLKRESAYQIFNFTNGFIPHYFYPANMIKKNYNFFELMYTSLPVFFASQYLNSSYTELSDLKVNLIRGLESNLKSSYFSIDLSVIQDLDTIYALLQFCSIWVNQSIY